MPTRNITFVTIVLFCLTPRLFGQAPPNDNFADRTVLVGDDITFTGSLAGATFETNEPSRMDYWSSSPATNSVWWTWTAPQSGPVTIVAVSISKDTFVAGYEDASCGLEVYAGTNVLTDPPPNPACQLWPNPAIDKASVSFLAEAGTSCQFQFLGLQPALSITFHLIATNSPIILEPPTDQTVFSNGCALFTVLAVGLPPFSYQWRLNGADLPGENGPILALMQVTPEQAGSYSVLVSNATGVTLAGPANLAVNSNPIHPTLRDCRIVGANALEFSLCGESGRYYQIESSSDLSTWRMVTNFPAATTPFVILTNTPQFRSVVYNTNAVTRLVVTNPSATTFYRASLYQPANEVCETNLKQIRFAERLFARQVGYRTAGCYADALRPFLPNVESLSCPSGGTYGFFATSYSLSDVSTEPMCMIDPVHHLLREPR